MAKSKQLFLEVGEGLSLMIGLPTLSSWDTLNRPKEPKTGTFGFNTQTNSFEYWDGENWLAAALS